MYKNILVPISFEEGRDSAQAIEVAKFLADDDAKITLLHVMEHVPTYAQTYLPEDYIENSRAGVETDLKARAEAVPGGRGKVVSGHSGTTILQVADDDECDLIIIASHRPGMSDYFLGSTAHHVVRHAQCAVHVIR